MYPARVVATVDQLRKLALVIPPSERFAGAEAGDILSAVVAVLNHGDALLNAAELGVQAVHDFYYDVAVKHATANGQPAPQKGVPQEQPVEAGGRPTTPSGLEPIMSILTQVLQRLGNLEQGSTVAPEVGSGFATVQAPTTGEAQTGEPVAHEPATAHESVTGSPEQSWSNT